MKLNNMEDLTKGIGLFVIAVLFICFAAILLAFPTMWLWNWLMPTIFGLIKINFWKALGLNMLTGILFRTSNYSNKK